MGRSRKQRGRKSKGKGYNTDLQSPIEVLIPTLILAAFAIIIGIGIIRLAEWRNNKAETDMQVLEENIWLKEYLRVESSKVGVIFDPIATTNEEYIQLRDECNKFIEEDNNKQIDAHVQVDTIIDEEQYIDNTQSSLYSTGQTENEQISELSETGPIYFQDMLMIRYMDTSGRLKVVTGILNRDSGEVWISGQSSLKTQYELNITINTDTDKDTEENPTESAQQLRDWKSEQEYLLELESTIRDMLTYSNLEEYRQAESKAINYFTYEGKQSVFDSKKNIASGDTQIETVFMKAGKSDSSKTYKDRIYLQLRATVDGEETDIYMILKLNSNIRIFDIDLV